MNICIVLHAQLPQIKYAGTERVVWYLGQELQRMGHRVSYICGRGSDCPFAQVIEYDPYRPIREQIPMDVDIAHFHVPVPEDYDRPHVLTIHGNALPQGRTEQAIFVSRNHAERFGSSSWVHNGLDWDAYQPLDLTQRRTRFHFLGKAAWRVKNLRGAIDITHDISGGRLDVLGGYRLNLKMGFRLTLSPWISFHGMVDDAYKSRIIQRSRGLLFPVTWHEPFGLAIVESLYMGAPVFGTPYGSLPELVSPEVGYLSNSRSELVRHIQEHSYDPKRCHEYARDLYNAQRMARAYLSKYEQVLSGQCLNPIVPVALEARRSLEWLD